MPPHDAVDIPGLHRKEQRPHPRWLVPLIAAIGVLAVTFGVLLTHQTGQVEDQRDQAVQQKIDLGRQVTDACLRGDVVQSPDGRDLCATAAQAQVSPTPAASVQGERGPGPTAEQIRAAVAEYLAVHPPPAGQAGRSPTADEVAAAVAQYLAAHPPQPGRPPTAAEIADAVATYFATNPPPAGKDGRAGDPGRAPTAEEIRAAVAAYLAQHPPPQGERGPTGPAGPNCPDGSSLDTVQFADDRFGLACVFDDQPDSEPTPEPTTARTPPPMTTTEPPDDGESEPGP